MKKNLILRLGLIAFMTLLPWGSAAQAGPLEDLIAGAKKEGTIEFYGPSTLGPEGAQAIVSAFNKKY